MKLLNTLFVTLFLFAGSLFGGEKDMKEKMAGRLFDPDRIPEFEILAEREKDLAITATQKLQIEKLKDKVGKQREKLRDDPDVRAMFKQLVEARKDGNEDKMRGMRDKVKEMMDKKNAGDKQLNEELGKILNPQQLQKLQDLRRTEMVEKFKDMKEGRGGAKPGDKTPESQKPDPSKGPPKVYQD